MTLQDLGNIGEFMGAIAVVVSLIYLAVQIRQNTSQLNHNAEVMEANAELDNARLASEFNAQVAASPLLAELWVKALGASDDLDIDQRTRLGFLMGDLFYRLEGLYRQHRRGFLGEESWRPWERLMTNLLAAPVVRGWWESRAHPFSETFTAHVDSLLGATPDGAGGVR